MRLVRFVWHCIIMYNGVELCRRHEKIRLRVVAAAVKKAGLRREEPPSLGWRAIRPPAFAKGSLLHREPPHEPRNIIAGSQRIV